jgi:sphinganine-1-phosphate aldolase
MRELKINNKFSSSKFNNIIFFMLDLEPTVDYL